jgi:hypothetical protein
LRSGFVCCEGAKLFQISENGVGIDHG